MQFDLASALLAIVVFQLLFLAFFLLRSRRGKRQSNMLLGLFFLMVGISMLDMWLTIHGLHRYYLSIAFWDDGFILAIGPLILLYVRSIMYRDYSLRLSNMLHFIPFGVITLYFIGVSLFSSPEERMSMMEDLHNFNLPLLISIATISLYLHSLAYLYVSRNEVRNYRSLVQEQFSSMNKLNYKWLDFTIKSLLILIILAIVHAIVPYSLAKSYYQVSAIFFIGFIFYFANRVILKGLLQPALFGGILTTEIEKYKTSTLTKEEKDQIRRQLVQYIENQKPHLDPDLNIDELARSIEVHSKTLSQVINQTFHKSFYDFINYYRVEEAKTLFDGSVDENMTIQEVMYQSGFNSKSSFNTFFRKFTGMTPTQYKRQTR